LFIRPPASSLPKADLVVFRLVSENGGESYWVRRLRIGR
jgi:hypothetical protein